MQTRAIHIVLLIAIAAAASAAGQVDLRPPDRDGREKRRSPVVEVVERCKDSVVNFVSPKAEGRNWRLREFFDVIPDEPGRPIVSELGSGFVVHADGYIMTNAHVVNRSIRHTVVLADGTELPAEVVGIEPDYDLALVKVDASEPLTPVTLGIGGDVMVGETVVSIGNPHGLKHTATAGIVSALDRSTITEPQKTHLRGLIQTDAPINPGNSGGPLFNALGEVIGVIVSVHAGQNLAFAISGATVRERLAAMLDGEARYGIATGLTVSADGRTIDALAPDSPAAGTELRAGDRLERIAGRRIDGPGDFALALVGHEPGDVIEIEAWRGGAPVRAKLELTRRAQSEGAERLWALVGVRVRAMTDEESDAMGLRFDDGLVVTDVRASQYAGQDPPRVGDVLARIGLERPRDLDQAARLLEIARPGAAVPVVFVRHRDGIATRVDVTMRVHEARPDPAPEPAPAGDPKPQPTGAGGGD